MPTRWSLLFALVCVVGCAGGASSTDSDEDVEGSEEALTTPCTLEGGTESYDGIAGSYERVGTLRKDEIRTLTVGSVSADGREAHYDRRIKKKCTGPGCDVESGVVSMLPDNPAFPNNFAFTPDGANEPKDMYFVLGVRREAGAIKEMCIARVVTSMDVRRAFMLRRVP